MADFREEFSPLCGSYPYSPIPVVILDSFNRHNSYCRGLLAVQQEETIQQSSAVPNKDQDSNMQCCIYIDGYFSRLPERLCCQDPVPQPVSKY